MSESDVSPVGPGTGTATAAHAAADGRPAGVAAASVAVGTLVSLGIIGRDLWFASDEWNIITEYPSGNLLVPFNGHLSAVPVALYQVLFHTTGVVDHLPYRLLGLVSLGVLSLAVWRYARERVGGWAAVVALAAILWNSSGSTNLLFPFLLNFSLPIALLVVAWWALDRDRPRHDALAGAALVVALASSGLGVVAMIAVVAELLVERAPLRRWAVVVLPGATLWGLWWATHRSESAISTDLLRVARYAARMLLGGTTALAAGSTLGGVLLAVALVALAVVGLFRWPSRPGEGSGRIVGALAAPAAFALLTALTRIDTVPAIPPDELRYGWTIGAYAVLAAVACWRPGPADAARLRDGGRRVATVVVALAAVTVVLSGAVLWRDLQRWVGVVESNTPGIRTNLYATEAVGAERVDPDVVLPLSFVPVTTGRYLDAVRQLGSPIEGAGSDRFGGRPDQLEVADRVLATSLEVTATEPPEGSGTADSPCGADRPADPGSGVVVDLPGPAPVVVRRFGNAPVFTVDLDAGPTLLRLPADAPLPTDVVLPYRLDAPPGARCGRP